MKGSDGAGTKKEEREIRPRRYVNMMITTPDTNSICPIFFKKTGIDNLEWINTFTKNIYVSCGFYYYFIGFC